MIRNIKGIILAIISSSILWSLWGNITSVRRIKELKPKAEQTLINCKKEYCARSNTNNFAQEFFNNYGRKITIADMIDDRSRLPSRYPYSDSDIDLIDSINYYNQLSEIEADIFSSSFSYCTWICGSDMGIYKSIENDNLYLGSPYRDCFNTKYEIFINNKLQKTRGNEFIVPISTEYDIKVNLLSINTQSGLVDTTTIKKAIQWLVP